MLARHTKPYIMGAQPWVQNPLFVKRMYKRQCEH